MDYLEYVGVVYNRKYDDIRIRFIMFSWDACEFMNIYIRLYILERSCPYPGPYLHTQNVITRVWYPIRRIVVRIWWSNGKRVFLKKLVSQIVQAVTPF